MIKPRFNTPPVDEFPTPEDYPCDTLSDVPASTYAELPEYIHAYDCQPFGYSYGLYGGRDRKVMTYVRMDIHDTLEKDLRFSMSVNILMAAALLVLALYAFLPLVL